jgi:hypothetical protein
MTSNRGNEYAGRSERGVLPGWHVSSALHLAASVAGTGIVFVHPCHELRHTALDVAAHEATA